MRIGEYPANSDMATANETTERSAPPAGARRFAPSLLREGRLLLRMGIGKPLIAQATLRAADHATTVEEELLASGMISEAVYFEALAEMLGLNFMADIDARRVQDVEMLDTQLIRPEMLRIHHASQSPITVVVPSLARLDHLTALLQRTPQLKGLLAVSTPSAVRKAAWEAGRSRRVVATTRLLFETTPLHSARITFWGKQGFYTGITLYSVVVLGIMLPMLSLLALHLSVTLFYLANFLIRLYALTCAFIMKRPAAAPAGRLIREPPPVYSILVALYKEQDVAAQLVAALDRIEWPRSRLDIKLICEEDDHETITALRALSLAPEYEIVLVPVHLPRTKPKALSYALPGVRGQFVTVYDAEDRPDPGQLREAYAAFMAATAQVICLQAPLIITNMQHSWLSSLFALEYAGLFRGLLPMLSLMGLPMPLGGTSNHFRTRELRQIGGWDPYNVTEDADLGMRLHRMGYRSRVIYRPTLEDAPVTLSVWIGQRTRWFKGWLQTWLVLMRKPGRLGREMGWGAFTVFQILVAGMLLSSLSHPIIIGFLCYLTWMMFQEGTHTDGSLAFWLFIADVVNIFGSYAVFISLGRNRMGKTERRALGWRWVFVPVYWLAMSLAAWKAVVELNTNPFAWKKTPHLPVRQT